MKFRTWLRKGRILRYLEEEGFTNTMFAWDDEDVLEILEQEKRCFCYLCGEELAWMGEVQMVCDDCAARFSR